jgi:2C-methyl-D-erythritol 2,4-cyclodiphosphate synthase
MKSTIATALAIPLSAVGITAGTNEKLGYVGEGKGVTVYAYVSLTEHKTNE